MDLPPDIHPLPDSVHAYVSFFLILFEPTGKANITQFVYPFRLEPHILTLESSRRNTLAAHAARRVAYLKSREEEKERRERNALRKIAPGFEPHGGPLVPVREVPQNLGGKGEAGVAPARDVMDDLVDQLAALENNAAG